MTTEPDELDKIREEEAAKQEAAVYETLEDDIMDLRSTIMSQAILLKEMGLGTGFANFFTRITTLEKLQQKYDEWDPEFEEGPRSELGLGL